MLMGSEDAPKCNRVLVSRYLTTFICPATTICANTSLQTKHVDSRRAVVLEKWNLITLSKVGMWGLHSFVSLCQAKWLKPRMNLSQKSHDDSWLAWIIPKQMSKLYVHTIHVWEGKQLWQCHCVVCWWICCRLGNYCSHARNLLQWCLKLSVL